MKIKLWLALGIFLISKMGFSQTPLTIQATNTTVCPGTPVTLYAIGNSATTTWQPGGLTGQYITVQPTTTTTYTLTSGSSSTSYTVQICADANCTDHPSSSFDPLRLSTGNNGLTSMLAYNQTDLNWTYSTTLNGTYVPAVVSDNVHIPPNYSKSNWPNAQWIGPNGDLSTISSSYYYRVQFTLTAQEASSLVLSMQFMADNIVTGVSVNNILVPNSATPTGTTVGFQLPNASSVTMQGNWVEGLNTITVAVTDYGGYSAFVGQLNPAVRVPIQDITCTTLPIHFISFDGEIIAGEGHLTWQAIMDKMSHFFIERSEDGIHFNTIGTIELENTKQNYIPATYAFKDHHALSGTSYYRIVAYETDGAVSYSRICAVAKNEALTIKAVPNPNKGMFTLSGTVPDEETNSIRLFNCTGECVYTTIIHVEAHYFATSIDLSPLPAGIYFVKLGYNQSTIKIMKE